MGHLGDSSTQQQVIIPDPEKAENKTMSVTNIAVVVLLVLVLYVLTNGINVPQWLSKPSRSTQRKYKPISAKDGDD